MEGAGQEQTLSSEGTKRKIAEDFELARQKALEVVARLNTAAEHKRPRFDSPDAAYANSSVSQPSYPEFTAQTGQYNGSQGTSKKIHIPNGKVGVIIGRGGDMIKNLQHHSGARIQITRDSDADPTSLTREVELMGTAEQISRAEQLVNEVIAETDAAGAAGGSSGNRIINPVQSGGEQFVMKVPSDKVALIIGKGGETIKSMQSKSGARIQVVPLHPPPGDTSTERSVYISGTQEQIDSAKELVNDVMSGNRLKTYSGSTGYTQAAYPPSGGWAPQGQPPVHQQQQQQAGYGYGQQQGSYAMPPPYYGSYPTQQASWDQTNPSAVPPQPQQNTTYNMYGHQQVQPAAAPPPPNAGYGYSQAPRPSSAYNYNQGYPQQSPAYGQDASTQPPATGTEQQKPYVNPPNPVYGQQPPPSQPDVNGGPQASHPGYGVTAGSTTTYPDAGTSQSQPSPAYGTRYSQPATTAPVNGYGTYPSYGPPSASYNQAGYTQTGYSQAPPASYPYYGQSGYPPNYYQGAYPPAPGQPTSAASQPLSYGAEKADDGNSVAGSAATAQQAES